MALLAKLDGPCDSTLCGTDPVDVQVHLTVVPTATVSIAGFWVPLLALLNRMLPTTIWPATPPPPPPTPAPPPPAVGEVGIPPPAGAPNRSTAVIPVPARMSFSSSARVWRSGIASIDTCDMASAG